MIERRARDRAPYNGVERRAFNRSAMPSYANHDDGGLPNTAHHDTEFVIHAGPEKGVLVAEEKNWALPPKPPNFTA